MSSRETQIRGNFRQCVLTPALRPKVFQVLHYLLRHRDRVISKQELREQVWPDQFVSDAALEGVLKAVRQAVGDSRRTRTPRVAEC